MKMPQQFSLSFSRGDIIEVLTELETGRYDLFNDEHTSFPSNFVQPVFEQGTEAEFSRMEYAACHSEFHNSAIEASQRACGEPLENNL